MLPVLAIRAVHGIGTHAPRDKFVPKKSGDTGLQSAANISVRASEWPNYYVTGVFKGKRAIFESPLLLVGPPRFFMRWVKLAAVLSNGPRFGSDETPSPKFLH